MTPDARNYGNGLVYTAEAAEEMAQSIRVWPFRDAPEQYKELSQHGGDEDWLAVVPYRYANDALAGEFPFLRVGPFGVCDVSSHVYRDGTVVFIGAHA